MTLDYNKDWPVGKQIRVRPIGLTELVKRPLMLALIAIAKRWPEPTRANCAKPNSQKLFDIWEEFNQHQTQRTSRANLFDAAFKIFICTYEAHAYYSQRFDWIMGKLINSNWDTADNNPGKNWR